MGKTEEDWNGLKLGFLTTVQPNSFSKLIPTACNFKNNAQETYLFVSDLWFCHLRVISLLTLSGHSDWGRVIGKIKQNELDCCDTAPLKDSKADVLSVRLSSFILSDVGLALKTNPNLIVQLSKYQCYLSVHKLQPDLIPFHDISAMLNKTSQAGQVNWTKWIFDNETSWFLVEIPLVPLTAKKHLEQ